MSNHYPKAGRRLQAMTLFVAQAAESAHSGQDNPHTHVGTRSARRDSLDQAVDLRIGNARLQNRWEKLAEMVLVEPFIAVVVKAGAHPGATLFNSESFLGRQHQHQVYELLYIHRRRHAITSPTVRPSIGSMDP